MAISQEIHDFARLQNDARQSIEGASRPLSFRTSSTWV